MAIQLQEFAKQVLFGTTLEEKLIFPRENIVDTAPGNAVKTPKTLPRPAYLSLRQNGERVNPPSNAKLIDENERGRLLHFFCNHELLATELMALALLKFPEASATFRQGLLETLKEEQIHTKLYIHRMKQCGVEFGELPLSDYFWKSVSSMEDPLDYVSRLSLTFEQANLDYTREYGKLFETIGDVATAGILDKIYRDEINHVGFGLKWFRHWKVSGKSDWEAFRECLVFPLSPSRAKGNYFNREGRIEAGFDESFISDLQVFHQSRGRTPSVLWYNPEAEIYAAKNSDEGYRPDLSTVQNDLAFLPAFLARRDDILIMTERPSQEFLTQIQNHGFSLPEIMECKSSSNVWKPPAISRKISDIRPWAWTPESVSFFKNTFASLTRKVNVDTLWNDGVRNLHSKSWSVEWGKHLASELVEDDWVAPEEVYGRPAKNLHELIALRDHFNSLGYRNIVCKAPFGSAAHGNRCIMADETIAPEMRTWLDEVWMEQDLIIVEPWLKRIYDFSVQFEKRAANMKALAFTRLVNNERGQFRGIVVNGFCNGIDPDVTRFLLRRIKGRPRVYSWYEETIGPRLESELDTMDFSGPLGIDAFVYRDLSGRLKLKTMVELNPRFTMGRLGYELGHHIAASSVGYFQIFTHSQIRKSKTPGIVNFADELKRKHPVEQSTDTKPRIVSGSFPLNDPHSAKQFLAVYHVRETVGELPI